MKILDFCEGVPIPPRQLLWFSVKGLHFRSLGSGVMQKDKLFLWTEKINKKRKRCCVTSGSRFLFGM